jgi:hypothetical protein
MASLFQSRRAWIMMALAGLAMAAVISQGIPSRATRVRAELAGPTRVEVHRIDGGKDIQALSDQ